MLNVLQFWLAKIKNKHGKTEKTDLFI